ncbi:unnamed protein product [Agarophyton chilense]|eukprot:gb/GEZJ01000452.1/.p1 GENE.gb/GEZJ01000452.1/~~gb/GEZJ01000452.1/.p1  ORF type:complete len:471 (-),score=52.10 gb/GEZJ01000452.1/:1384-2796(-)
MATAFILCVGSRGDTEPLAALTVALLNDDRFDKIHFCAQSQYHALVPDDERLVVHNIPMSVNSMWLIFVFHVIKEKMLSLLRWESFDIIRAQCAGLTSYVTRLVAPTLPTLSELVKETRPSFILATSLAGVVGNTVAEHANLPFFLLHMQPNTPTSSFPFYLSTIPNSRLAASEISSATNQGNGYKTQDAYLSSYDTQIGFHTASLNVINSFRRNEGLPEMEREDVAAIFRGEKENLHILHSYPIGFIRSPLDWSNQIHVIPPLADDFIPPGWTAETHCPMLKQFLDEGEKPVCITLGSVTVNGRESLALQTMLTACRETNVKRLVIIKGAAGLGEELVAQVEVSLRQWIEEHVFWSSEQVQYAWLFPECNSVVCHGGAGTVAAALRAGIPIVVAPIMSDQYFWGDLVQSLGLGAFLEKGLIASTVADFKSVLDIILSTEVQQKAFSYGATEKCGANGTTAAISILANSV